jgi:hypothetical protein
MQHGRLEGNVVAEIGVAIAVEHLLRAGFLVAVPIVDDGYDLLAFSGRRCWRLQVKATSMESGRSPRVCVRRGARKRIEYSARHVDAFIGVHVTRRLVVCVPVASCRGKSWIYLRKHAHGDFSSLQRIKRRA